MAVDGGERNCGVNELICVRRVSPEALGLLSAISVLLVLMLVLFVYLNNKLSSNQERGSAPSRLDELSGTTAATAGSGSAQAEKSCSSSAPAELTPAAAALGSSSSSDSDEELLGQYLHHPHHHHHHHPIQEGAPLAGRSARGSSLLRSWDCRPNAAYCPAVSATYDGYSSEASAHDASYIQRMRRTPPLDELQPPPYRHDENGSPHMSCCTPSDLGLGGANTPYDLRLGGANNNDDDDAKGGGGGGGCMSPAGTDSPLLLLYASYGDGDKCPSDGEDDGDEDGDSGDSGTLASRQNDMERYLTKAYGEDAPCSDSTAPLSAQGISANGWEALFPKGYEANPDPMKHGGTLDVLLDYQPSEQRLAVTVTSVTDTPALQRSGNLAWQVHMVLLPGRKQRARTSVQKGACPMFTETFCFSHVDAQSVGEGDSALRFRLYSVRRMKREQLLGEKVFYLSKMHLQGRMSVPVILDPCCPLPAGGSQATVSDASCSDSVVSSFQSLYHSASPELLLGLLYNATTGRLSVEVVKGSHFKHLPTDKPPHGLFCCLKHLIGGQVYIIRDTYVKLTLLNAVGQEMSKCKTSTCRGQPNPTYKETFTFQVALFQLSDVTLMLSVFNKRSLQRKELLGWISLGLNSSGDHELAHWTHMKECKGQQVCRWHGLLES